jgi:hypothetical protein
LVKALLFDKMQIFAAVCFSQSNSAEKISNICFEVCNICLAIASALFYNKGKTALGRWKGACYEQENESKPFEYRRLHFAALCPYRAAY